MPRTQITDEVQVLKFFEDAPIEQAQMLFNIVKEKMRTRIGAGSGRIAEGRRKEKTRSASSETPVTPGSTPQ